MDNETVIELLKKKQGNRTQKEMAEEIGVSDAYISDVIRGSRGPSEKILRYIGLERSYRKMRTTAERRSA